MFVTRTLHVILYKIYVIVTHLIERVGGGVRDYSSHSPNPFLLYYIHR